MFQRRGEKCKEEEILVHNINQFNNKKDETESIEKSYDSRRVPKAVGRGGARYVVLLLSQSPFRTHGLGRRNEKEKTFIINV